jgi:hypothetical protein
MTERLQIGGYEIEYDRDATAAAYSVISIPGPEGCGCAYCRNWIAGRERAVHSEALALLSKLGIPANGEIEVYEYPGGSKPHGYGGWYMFVGRLLSKPSDETKGFGTDAFSMKFTSGQSFGVPAFDDLGTCELQFYTELDEYLSPKEYETTKS